MQLSIFDIPEKEKPKIELEEFFEAYFNCRSNKRNTANATAFEVDYESNYTELDKNFMTEKILGMHFIYHTRYSEFDGWRPPKHEPILIIGMWLNNRIDPLKVDLKTRLDLYKKFFPDRRYKFDCSCAIKYSSDYHGDGLWR